MKSDQPMDDRSSIASADDHGNGKDQGPTIADALTPEEIEAIEKLASGASEGARCAEAGLLGDPEAVEAMVAKLTKQSTARPWLVYREIDDGPDDAAVLLGYFGNGPEAEANARFFAIARSCVFALLVHVRKLERERAFLGGQLEQLARCILDYHASEIGKGGSEGAVDVAVRLLTPIKVDMEET